MLITFKTKVAADITMFGHVAEELLKLMGQSGVVPGALLGADIAPALERLKQAIAVVGAKASGNPPSAAPEEDAEHAPPPVNLRQRAYPLIGLLEAAAKAQADVTWAPTKDPLL
ncbi:MAG: DUF1840 domain-containing protein [Burkholderiales bacterium]|nr:DUF1840 domain-containing protein [Burkholderiales bacterium]